MGSTLYGNCANQSTNKIITAGECGRKLTLNNPLGKKVRKIQVDGCLFKDSDACKRCDYMFEVFENANAEKIGLVLYLELKGSHIEDAYAQLVATIDKFHVEHKGAIKQCYIVSSRVPSAGPSTQQLNIKLQKARQATLVIKTTQAQITI